MIGKVNNVIYNRIVYFFLIVFFLVILIKNSPNNMDLFAVTFYPALLLILLINFIRIGISNSIDEANYNKIYLFVFNFLSILIIFAEPANRVIWYLMVFEFISHDEYSRLSDQFNINYFNTVVKSIGLICIVLLTLYYKRDLFKNRILFKILYSVMILLGVYQLYFFYINNDPRSDPYLTTRLLLYGLFYLSLILLLIKDLNIKLIGKLIIISYPLLILCYAFVIHEEIRTSFFQVIMYSYSIAEVCFISFLVIYNINFSLINDDTNMKFQELQSD